MIEQQYQQYAIVQSNTASTLTEKLNQKLRELKDKEPSVEFDGLTARIKYLETVLVPEDLADEYKMHGIDLKCASCPFFEPLEKTDGTVDERAKRGKCPCAKYGIAFSDGRQTMLQGPDTHGGTVRGDGSPPSRYHPCKTRKHFLILPSAWRQSVATLGAKSEYVF